MSRNFDGGSDWFRNTTMPMTAVPLTAFVLFKNDGGTSNARFWGLYSSSSTTNYFIMSIQNTGGALFAGTRDGIIDAAAITANSATANEWHRGMGIWHGTADRRAVLDGGTVATNTADGAPTGLNRHSIGLLDRTSSPIVPFSGDIELVVVWNVAIPDAVAQAMTAGTVNPLRYYPANIKSVWWGRGTTSAAIEDLGPVGGTFSKQGGDNLYAAPGPMAPLWSSDPEWSGAFTAAAVGGTILPQMIQQGLYAGSAA